MTAADVKAGPGHALYEKIRAIEARAKRENRQLTAEEAATRDQLGAEMTSTYDEAYEKSQGGPQ